MTYISTYDDTDSVVQKLCEELDVTEPELVDMLIDIAYNNDTDIRWIIDHAEGK